MMKFYVLNQLCILEHELYIASAAICWRKERAYDSFHNTLRNIIVKKSYKCKYRNLVSAIDNAIFFLNVNKI